MADAKENSNPLPLIVIFGRTNVGKSTLFNCLTEKRQALVSNMAGTTRDSNLGKVFWRGHNFEIVDTGGIINLRHLTGKAEATDDIGDKVQKQALRYLKQADLVVFLVDNKTGLLPQDSQMALLIKKNIDAQKIILAVNKVDAPKDRLKIFEFYKLSLGQPYPISAANGSGTGDLLDIITKKLKFRKSKSAKNYLPEIPAAAEDGLIKVCIIGKPNVGKSSLLNSLLGYERVIVSPLPHTTREPQHTKIFYQDQPLLLIDTAGISKRGDKAFGLEKFGIAKSLSALAKSDIALLIMDISQEITRQDAKLVEEIVNTKKSFIFIANKWDKIKERNTKKYTDYIYGKLPFARFAPIQFISALTGEKVHPVRYNQKSKKISLVEFSRQDNLKEQNTQLSNGVKKIFDLILKISQERKLELSDNQLKKFLLYLVKVHRPSKGKGVRHPRIRDFHQTDVNPPKFELKIGAREDLHFSYIRFIENRLRENYGFLGTPLTIKIAKNRTVPGQHRD